MSRNLKRIMEMEGLDLRPDEAQQMPGMTITPEDLASGGVRSMPGLDLTQDEAQQMPGMTITADDLASGGVRTMPEMDLRDDELGTSVAEGARPGGMKGFFGNAIAGAGRPPPRKPLVSPEVAAYVSQKVGGDEPQAPDMEAAKKRARLADILATATDQLAVANGTYDAGRSNRMHANAQSPVDEAKEKQAAVEAFVARKLGLERQAKADARQADLDALNKRNVESEIAARDRSGQPKPVNPLDDELKREQIAEIKARTAKLSRRGAGGPAAPKPVDEKERLQIEKLRQEVSGEDPRKVSAAESSAQRMRGLISELRRIHSGGVNPETGKYEEGVGTEFGGTKAAKMGQLMTQIRIEAKNLAELGALSGPDMQLMEQMTGSDPSSLGANLKGLINIDNTDSNLDGLEKWVKNAEGSARSVYGPHNGTQDASPKSGPTPTGRTKTDRNGIVWEELSDGTARQKAG